jgi:hypothetical protein
MENIPLRAYNLEIGQLIDNNRSQDALDHCQRILKQYPQCLDTFRLMGKAYLELRQYDKAEEVFNKVLSFMPDDFTGNLGMSLLREKQTNLEGTIWHMERAYEAQPSNTAVQNELRRLYKQRDGVDSPRIRLTRGALVRMYLRGDLIPQALNEIQSILHDDPSRMDIKVLQAVANLKAGKSDEAFQVCREILNDLPYCYEANRILFENPSSLSNVEEAQAIQQRLRELDPYFEFTSPEHPNPEKIAAEEVQIEIPEGLGPNTATRKADQSQSFSAFDVFNQPSFSPDSVSGNETNGQAAFTEKTFSSEESIPSWMDDIQKPTFQDANNDWTTGSTTGELPVTPSSGFDTGKPMTTEDSFPQNELPNSNDMPPFPPPDESEAAANPFLAVPGDTIPAAEPGDIPEWLRALASEPPAASSDAVTSPLRVPGETGVLQTGEENLDFLRNSPGEPVEPRKTEPQIASPSEQIDSLSTILPPSPFINSSESTQPVPLEEGKDIQPPNREVPDWLRSAVEPTAEETAGAEFRQELMDEIKPPTQAAPESVAIENQFQEPEPENSITGPVESTELPTPEIEQYLEQLRKDISPTDQPEWLKSENLGSDLEALFGTKEQPAVPPDESAPAESDWMSQLKKEEAAAPPQPSEAKSPASVPNVPDWLFTPEDIENETAPIQSDTPVTHQPPPDWLAAARPDIFSQDFERTETTPEVPEQPEIVQQDAFKPESPDISASPVKPPVVDTTTPVSEKPEINIPEMDYLKSEPLDLNNVDREPLEDNLEAANLSELAKEGLDFSKAAPVDSLPPDLAELLREETVSELTTNPLEVEPIPEFTLETNIPDLSRKEPEAAVQSTEITSETPQVEETPLSELFEQPETINSAADVVEEVKADEVDQSVEGFSTAADQVSEPEKTTLPEEISAKLEPPTVPVAPGLFKTDIPLTEEPVSAISESLSEPEQPVLQTEESAQVYEPLMDITPEKSVEREVPPSEMESEILAESTPIETSPIEEVPIEEIPIEEVPVKAAPVEVAPVEIAPLEEPLVGELPVEAPPVEQPEAMEPVIAKQPVVSFEEKPTTPESKQVKPARPSATPKPVHRIDKPAPTPPSIRRKGSGSAELTRAREAITKGDLQTALRRYIKLVNGNKALEHVSNDLKDLTRKHPKDFLVWQTYGDARLRANRIQEALDAYAKAADLLK